MMNLHPTTVFNVEATITKHYSDRLQEIARPDYLPVLNIVTDWPEITNSLPCISLSHIPGYRNKTFQGNRGGVGESVAQAHGILEVNCWVSRSQKYNNQEVWVARLRYLQSMVEMVHLNASLIIVSDYGTSLYYPQSTPYRIVMGDMSELQTAEDPNPDIQRRRAIVNYSWTMRRSI